MHDDRELASERAQPRQLESNALPEIAALVKEQQSL